MERQQRLAELRADLEVKLDEEKTNEKARFVGLDLIGHSLHRSLMNTAICYAGAKSSIPLSSW